jgi:hypothetical protein
VVGPIVEVRHALCETFGDVETSAAAAPFSEQPV